MFKYISEILSKFTQGQRIIALLLLLFSITLIAIGPKIVESFTHSTDELEIRVQSQNTQIIELTKRLNELNTQIIENQRQCTDAIVEREVEIMNQIADLEGRIKKEHSKYRNLEIQQTDPMVSRMGKNDEQYPRVAMSPAPEPQQVKIEIPQTNQMMLEGLNKIKSNIKKDIKSKKGQ
jgi:TolA-binding protein